MDPPQEMLVPTKSKFGFYIVCKDKLVRITLHILKLVSKKNLHKPSKQGAYNSLTPIDTTSTSTQG